MPSLWRQRGLSPVHPSDSPSNPSPHANPATPIQNSPISRENFSTFSSLPPNQSFPSIINTIIDPDAQHFHHDSPSQISSNFSNLDPNLNTGIFTIQVSDSNSDSNSNVSQNPPSIHTSPHASSLPVHPTNPNPSLSSNFSRFTFPPYQTLHHPSLSLPHPTITA